jgi:hypothetical protein
MQNNSEFFIQGDVRMYRMAQKTVIRTTVGIDGAHHSQLLALAEKHDVSVAWVIRYAVAQLLQNQENNQRELSLISLEGELL